MPRRNYLFILAMAVVSLACYGATDHNRYGRYFSEVMNKIDQYYVKRVDNDELFDAAVNGMLQTLDENSRFYEPEDAKTKLLSIIDQRYGGVGIEVGEDAKTGQIVVRGTIVGSPAYEADILAGDRLTRIDDRAVKAEKERRKQPGRANAGRHHQADSRQDRHHGSNGVCSPRSCRADSSDAQAHGNQRRLGAGR